MKTMRGLKGLHWLAPSTVVASLVAGVLFAVGHHVFYAKLAGTEAPTGTYSIAGADVSKQQFNTAVGTALAFLVKSALTLTISTAYVQALWQAVKASKKGMPLSTLDTTFSALENLLGLFRFHVWYKYPLLFTIAAVAWLIPIASIVTPATISIKSTRVSPPPSSMATVPNLDFTKLNYLNSLPVGELIDGNQTEYCYTGASTPVRRVASAVGAQGQILPITPPSANASWSLDFWAPVLDCEEPSDREINIIQHSIADALNEYCNPSWGYLAWTPSSKNIAPFTKVGNSSYTLQSNDTSTGAETSLYVAIIPRFFTDQVSMPTHVVVGGCMLEIELESSGASNNTINEMMGKDVATYLKCQARNASHHAEFHYVNGAQTVHLDVKEVSTVLQAQQCVTGPASPSAGGVTTVQGQQEWAEANCSTLNTLGEQCVFDPQVARRLSYQAMFDAFAEEVRGSVGLFNMETEIPGVYPDTNLVKSVLMDTKDMVPIQTWKVATDNYDLQTLYTKSNGSAYRGLSTNATVGTRGDFKTALQNLFTNFTISLMSEADLLPDYNSTFAPQQNTNVTFETFHNIYIYAESTLWIAYGIAIGVSTLIAGLGLIVMIAANSTYDTSFSTILRVSRTAELSEEVRAEDSSGQKPLSKHLDRARLRMGYTREKSFVSSDEVSEDAAAGYGGERHKGANVDESLLQTSSYGLHDNAR